jgi:hypothetical protein
MTETHNHEAGFGSGDEASGGGSYIEGGLHGSPEPLGRKGSISGKNYGKLTNLLNCYSTSLTERDMERPKSHGSSIE